MLSAAETGIASPEDGLGPVGYLELGEDIRSVVTNRFTAQGEGFGYFLVGVLLGHEG